MDEDILFLHAIFSSYQRVLQADVKKKHYHTSKLRDQVKQNAQVQR